MQDFFFIHKYTPFYIYSGVAAPCNTRIGEQRGKVNSCQTRMRQYRGKTIWISRKKRGERRIPTIETESEVRKTMRKLNEFLTNIVEKILKKIRWQNTKFNQQTISTILGWAFGCSLILIYKFIFA